MAQKLKGMLQNCAEVKISDNPAEMLRNLLDLVSDTYHITALCAGSWVFCVTHLGQIHTVTVLDPNYFLSSIDLAWGN